MYENKWNKILTKHEIDLKPIFGYLKNVNKIYTQNID